MCITNVVTVGYILLITGVKICLFIGPLKQLPKLHLIPCSFASTTRLFDLSFVLYHGSLGLARWSGLVPLMA